MRTRGRVAGRNINHRWETYINTVMMNVKMVLARYSMCDGIPPMNFRIHAYCHHWILAIIASHSSTQIQRSNITHLINIHSLGPQISSGKINLLHELCMCLGYIVECEDSKSELEEKVGSEGNECPERQLN